MKTWPIYMLLQNQFAYGDSHSAPSPSSDIQNEEAARYLDRIRAERSISSALIVGPGGPYEVMALGPHLPSPLTVLTSHGPECMPLRTMTPPVAVEVGDMHEMPFQSGVFDLVFSSNVLEHALAPYCALMEARRVLKPNGIGYFILPSFEGDEGGVGPFHMHCLTQQVWTELLRKTGFALSDAFVQPGVQPHATKSYTHYRCIAVAPPYPHDRVLSELITYKATQ
jgi:SAM-dependent methyltransferase